MTRPTNQGLTEELGTRPIAGITLEGFTTMAAKTATKKATKKSQKPAPEPIVEDEELETDEAEEVEADDEVEDEDLEELDEDEVEDTQPKKKSAAQEVTFGVSDLARYLAEKSGKKVTPRELRTLIRKMARDESGRVNREITPGNRTRYNWSGLKDPEVRAIVKAFNDGELEADKQAKLQELKDRKAKKDAAAKAEPAAKGKAKTKKKAKPAPVEVEDDDEELELDDDE